MFAARVAGFQLGLSMLRQQGLFVGVGLPPTSDGNFEISPFSSSGGIRSSSRRSAPSRMRDLIALAADGKVKTHVSRTGTLSEVPQIFSSSRPAPTWAGRCSPT